LIFGNTDIGGFIGRVTGTTTLILNCYQDSLVMGNSTPGINVGGFIGHCYAGSVTNVSNSWAQGSVVGTAYGGIGGFIGKTESAVLGVFYSYANAIINYYN